ncbi:MAG: hypothetical protein IKA07_00260, partial [Alistipes sp.]|nr:hypothetical protein [Alistipes sp.]
MVEDRRGAKNIIPLGLQPLPLASKGESNKKQNKTTKKTPPLIEGRWIQKLVLKTEGSENIIPL